MGHVVADVSKDSPAEDSDSRVPVIEEDCVGKLVEGGGEGDKESGWHD